MLKLARTNQSFGFKRERGLSAGNWGPANRAVFYAVKLGGPLWGLT